MENDEYFEVIGIQEGEMMENDDGSGKKAVFPLENQIREKLRFSDVDKLS